MAVNGPAEESQLVPAQKSQAGVKSFVDASAQAYSASPMQLEGVDLWKWLVGLMLVLLLAEFLLGGPIDFARGGRRMNLQQTIYEWLGRMLGLEQVQSVADFKFSFAAAWAQRAPMLLLFGFVGLVAAAAVFYFRHQPNRHRRWRVVLFVIRAAVLCQVLLLLAEPILTLTIQSRKRPALWLLFDGTDSMNIADDLPPEVRAATDKAVGIDEAKTDTSSGAKSPGEAGASSTGQRPSRIEYLRALVQKKDQNLLEQLGKQFRLQAFLFESTQSVRSLELGRGLGPIDGKHVAEQLTANGQVTDLGGAITDLAHRNPSSSLAGLIVFSDFNKTTGPDPAKAAQQFGAKIYTVGVGATRAVDLAAKIVAVPYGEDEGRSADHRRLAAHRTRRPNHARPPVCRTAGRRQRQPHADRRKGVAATVGLDADGGVHLQAGAAGARPSRGRSGPPARRSQSGKEPCPRRDQRPRRLPAADVRRVRADLGMALHQRGVPSRSRWWA